jgi:hypothetical protein
MTCNPLVYIQYFKLLMEQKVQARPFLAQSCEGVPFQIQLPSSEAAPSLANHSQI